VVAAQRAAVAHHALAKLAAAVMKLALAPFEQTTPGRDRASGLFALIGVIAMILRRTTESIGARHLAQGLLWLARGAFVLIGLVIVLSVSGSAYEAVLSRGDARAHPAPGRLVDVGGFSLHISCVGAGSPTIVLDAGLGETSLDWNQIQPQLATKTKVCAYDRAGMGWSDPSSRARTPANIAEELHMLLINADIGGPYVLVAHSLSGKSARLFALRYRNEMAGLVLIDARSEYVDSLTIPAENAAFVEAIDAQGRLYELARRFGIARLFGASLAGSSAFPAKTRKLMALVATTQSAIASTAAEARARAASDAELRAAPALGDIPLVVLVSDQSIATVPHWQDAQRRQAQLGKAGRMVIASGSSHYIQWDQPDLVVNSVRETIASAR
jgi:pimeloyl-ACP methyl ester carboxylesterase